MLANLVEGVTAGYRKALEIQGVGYKAEMKGKNLVLSVGYAHQITLPIPGGVTVALEGPTRVVVTGSDKQAVGQFASDVRRVRKPEPYKGKGIRYEGEVVKIKAGKASRAGANSREDVKREDVNAGRDSRFTSSRSRGFNWGFEHADAPEGLSTWRRTNRRRSGCSGGMGRAPKASRGLGAPGLSCNEATSTFMDVIDDVRAAAGVGAATSGRVRAGEDCANVAAANVVGMPSPNGPRRGRDEVASTAAGEVHGPSSPRRLGARGFAF